MSIRLLAVAVAAAALCAGCGGAPDARLIAFARAPATNVSSDIYLLQTDGHLQRLTHGGIDAGPTWSPDGRRIAFERSHRNGTSLHVVNADGSGLRRLPGGVSGPVDWSPDGTRLVFTDKGSLFVTGTYLRGRRLLLDPAPDQAADPRFSPDGKQIVFALGSDRSGADVWVMDADGTHRTRVTRLAPGAGWPSSPIWSPDGARIAFLLPGSLDVIDADGTDDRVLTRFPNGVFPSSLAWSPDGETIVFARLRLGPDRHASGLYTVRADTGELHRLTRDIDNYPCWSTDGRQIVFQRLTGFHVSEITLMDEYGGNQVSLTGGGWTDATPVWQPGAG